MKPHLIRFTGSGIAMAVVMRRFCKTLCLMYTLSVGVAFGATSDDSNKFFTFTFENDIFVDEDDGYTNGTGITFGRASFDEFDISDNCHQNFCFFKTRL